MAALFTHHPAIHSAQVFGVDALATAQRFDRVATQAHFQSDLTKRVTPTAKRKHLLSDKRIHSHANLHTKETFLTYGGLPAATIYNPHPQIRKKRPHPTQ
ncbi:hypothetical protein ACUIAC_08825 [Dermabacteraceae bacterium P13138]